MTMTGHQKLAGHDRTTLVQRQALVCKNRPRVVFEIPVSPWLKDKFMEYYTRTRYGSSFFPSWLRKTGSKYVSSRLLVEQIYMEKKRYWKLLYRPNQRCCLNSSTRATFR